MVILSNNLPCGPHIHKIKTQVNKQLGFIKRKLRGCPQGLKQIGYMSMVQINLEYASTVWHPHLIKDIN